MATDIGEQHMDDETRAAISDVAQRAAHDVFARDGAVTAANAAEAIAAAITVALDEWMATYYEILDDEADDD